MKIAIGIEYDGSHFHGWQSQPSGDTVQDLVERALGSIAGEPVRLSAAGRTDAGVHALAQVAHFETASVRPNSAWVRGVNAMLPQAVAVQWAAQVSDDFHARYSAVSRTYRYVLSTSPVRPALHHGRIGWFHLPLNLNAMRSAIVCLEGEHDFSAFRSSECQAKSPVRILRSWNIERRGGYLFFEFNANGFLHHMVRNIVGCLVYVGKGRHPPGWLTEVLASRDRRKAAPTFSPDGLYFSAVEYAPGWKLPTFELGHIVFPEQVLA
ncbi:MAG: tRNA pseudouridine(38-40) synthase TruA [Betaproteobacteria bacterium]|nr:MAG: tRNA pseudouridine(38-40) synthase TruA [Betaproteobacteria bacterium]